MKGPKTPPQARPAHRARSRTLGLAGVLASALGLAAPTQANDTIAEATAGGLVLVRTDQIAMLEEDLYVSQAEVRVRYRFRNTGRADKTSTVAFPMPIRPLAPEAQEGDRAVVAAFQTRVDGRPVSMRKQTRAMLNGVDQSERLRRLGVPISNDEAAIAAALKRLSANNRAELVRAGLIRVDEGEPVALWGVQDLWWWEQTFPVGRNLRVEHSYAPGLGGTVASPWADWYAGPDGASERAAFCIDRAFLAGMAGGERRGLQYEPRTLGYILTTGGNWKGPIGRFRLVVNKGAPDTLVSFCGGGVRRLDATRFEVVRENWRPDRDLRVLFMVPRAAE